MSRLASQSLALIAALVITVSTMTVATVVPPAQAAPIVTTQIA